MVGEVDELEEDVEQCLSCLDGVIDVKERMLEKELVDKQEPRSEQNSPCYIVSEYRFNEMWFLTVDPLV